MAYATVDDVQARMTATLTDAQYAVAEALLDDAGVLIDAYNSTASDDVKLVVSCRMVIRAIGDGSTVGVPVGASQGSMSALGYSQTWTMTNGATGEVYISKAEKKMLGVGDKIGYWSPLQELVAESESDDE